VNSGGLLASVEAKVGFSFPEQIKISSGPQVTDREGRRKNPQRVPTKTSAGKHASLFLKSRIGSGYVFQSGDNPNSTAL
jgi:hypothetical protein